MNIVLTGFMASGKSATARAIAKLSGMRLIDTDDMITASEGRSINAIFASDGEAKFRHIEREAVRHAASNDGCVISTGGGVPLDKRNMDELRRNGVIVSLAPDFEVIAARIERAAKTRPLLRGESLEGIRKRFMERMPFYADCDVQIHVTEGVTPEQYAEQIIKIYEDRNK